MANADTEITTRSQRNITQFFESPAPKNVHETSAHGLRDSSTEGYQDTQTTLVGGEEWLSSVMKKITASKSIVDIRTVLCDMLAKIATQETKLMLLSQENDFLRKELKDLKDDVVENTQMTDLSITQLQKEVKNSGSKTQIEALYTKVDDLESRSRRNNLRFVGIPEGLEKREESTEVFIEKFISSTMGVDLLPGSVQRAHRVGPKPPQTDDRSPRPRAVVAYFLRFRDKEEVRLQAPKKKPNIQGTPVYINEDFTQQVLEKRKSLKAVLRAKREQGLRAWLSYDKLKYVQNGKVRTVAPNSQNNQPADEELIIEN